MNCLTRISAIGRSLLTVERYPTGGGKLVGSLNFAREEMIRPIETLSGGQKVKLAFAKMRLTRPNVLLLDEPSRHLSPLSNPAFRESVATYPGCVISISHDRAFLREVCTRVLRLTKDGLREEDRRLYAGDDD